MLRQKYTKQDILQRLYNHAVTFWGVQAIEDLDPLIQLLMQGFASLVYDVHNEIEDINVRILESLSNTLTPSVLIDPRPAHSIAQASPVEPEIFLDRKAIFHDKKLSLELREKGIELLSFAPVTSKANFWQNQIPDNGALFQPYRRKRGETVGGTSPHIR